MSLTTLNATIDRLREAAPKAQDEHRQWIAAIRANRALSPEGKRPEIAAAYLRYKTQLDGMLEQERDAVTSERQALERSIFGSFANDPTSLIAYRDAQDRARQLTEKDADRAAEMLKSAVLSGDKTLAAAVMSRATSIASVLGGGEWQRIFDEYASHYPAQADALNELRAIDRYVAQQESDPFNGWFGFFYLSKPTELSGLDDSEIKAVAEGQGDARSVLFGNGQTW